MNTIIRYGSLLMLGLVALFPMQAKADTTSPSDVEINFLDLYVSQKADCSSPIHVVHNTSTATQHFVAEPTLGAGSVPKGSYPCVIVGINSELTLTVGNSTTASNPPECLKGAIIHNQICRNGQSYQNPATNQLTACQTGTPTEVYAYFSTSGNASNGMSGNGGFVPTGALPLSSALVVTGNHNLQFVVDFDNTMSDDGTGMSSCNTQAPVMSAR